MWPSFVLLALFSLILTGFEVRAQNSAPVPASAPVNYREHLGFRTTIDKLAERKREEALAVIGEPEFRRTSSRLLASSEGENQGEMNSQVTPGKSVALFFVTDRSWSMLNNYTDDVRDRFEEGLISLSGVLWSASILIPVTGTSITIKKPGSSSPFIFDSRQIDVEWLLANQLVNADLRRYWRFLEHEIDEFPNYNEIYDETSAPLLGSLANFLKYMPEDIRTRVYEPAQSVVFVFFTDEDVEARTLDYNLRQFSDLIKGKELAFFSIMIDPKGRDKYDCLAQEEYEQGRIRHGSKYKEEKPMLGEQLTKISTYATSICSPSYTSLFEAIAQFAGEPVKDNPKVVAKPRKRMMLR